MSLTKTVYVLHQLFEGKDPHARGMYASVEAIEQMLSLDHVVGCETYHSEIVRRRVHDAGLYSFQVRVVGGGVTIYEEYEARPERIAESSEPGFPICP